MPTLAGSRQVNKARFQAGILRAGNPEVRFVFQVPFLRKAFCGSYLFRGYVDSHDRATTRSKF